MALSKTVRFYIRNKKKPSPQWIYLSVFIREGERLFYPTGIKVSPKHWDSKRDVIKSVALPELLTDNDYVHEIARFENSTKDNINIYLDNLRSVVKYALSAPHINNSNLSIQYLKDALDAYRNPKKEVRSITFFEFINRFIDDLISGNRLLDSNKIADPKTVQRYITARNCLQEFEKYNVEVLYQTPFDFDSWTEELWNQYISYLTFVRKFKINNIGFYQKQLKILLKAARKAKLYSVGDWLDDVKILAESPIDIFLNVKEIQSIENLDLSGNLRLEKVRDLFLVGCYTGFRVSDWSQVKYENIRSTDTGNQYIEIIPEKANATPPSTPLQLPVIKILEKYAGFLPKISEQKFNLYLKELCELAGINEKVAIKYTIAGKVKIDYHPKFTQVSSHTARRSFATNEFLNGMPAHLIMKATGHSTERNFLKYLKLDNSGAVDAMFKHKKLV